MFHVKQMAFRNCFHGGNSGFADGLNKARMPTRRQVFPVAKPALLYYGAVSYLKIAAAARWRKYEKIVISFYNKAGPL
jgi:hypothetical protein